MDRGVKMRQKSIFLFSNIVTIVLLCSLFIPISSGTTTVSLKNDSWPPYHEEVRFLPRVNVVHISDENTDHEYNFLTAIPMTIFHYDGNVYQSLLTTDQVTDLPTQYIIDDWNTYLSTWGGATDINFIGDVPDVEKTLLINKYGINPNHVSIINGTPLGIANQIAVHDWKTSDYVVIVPYLNPVTSESDIESISNGASLASLYNAPLLLTEPSSISSDTLAVIDSLGAFKAILVEIGDSLTQGINTQLIAAGVTIESDCTTQENVISLVRSITGKSTLCGILENWQNLPASMAAACYGGYVLFLPSLMKQGAQEAFTSLTFSEIIPYKLREPVILPDDYLEGEENIAEQFYNWLDTIGGNDSENLETVITFNTQPYYDPANGFDVTFERAISGDPSRLTDPGAVPGRMPLEFIGNIALTNRDTMYRATIFANMRPKHVTLSMNAYEVEHTANSGVDNWGGNHIVNEIFGWPFQGWCTENGNFPWQDIHDNMPDLSPILPPGPGNGPDCDPGQFASFLAGYETHFHSGAYAHGGSHPSQPDVPNCGFVQDLNNGSAFLYFSCHGGGTVIAVRSADNGIAQDSDNPVPWEGNYWPSTDGIVYDGSGGGQYHQENLDNNITNVHGAMTAYNACDMANGKMNEILLEHGGAASYGSYTSVSFSGSGWWWNIFVHCITHLNYTVGEAATYATARVAKLYTPGTPWQPNPDTTLQYVVYGDPNIHFVQQDWTSPEPASITINYGGHFPEAPPNKPPNIPERPTGRATGKPGVMYLYSSMSTDPEGQQLCYQWDWGDGNFSDWLGPVASGQATMVTHSWPAQGSYEVRVKCRDTFNEESDWSDPLLVTMPTSTQFLFPPFFNNFLRFLEHFPTLVKILSLHPIHQFFADI
jgi:hypothetical protein